MYKRIMLCAVLSFLTAAIFCQTQTPVYLSQTITNANSKGFYRYLPADYASSTKNYPLIIWLHGAGQIGQGNSTDLPKVLLYGLPNVISKGNFPSSFTVGDSSFSFIVISPQFISNPSGSNLAGFLTYVTNNYRVDPDRIYLLGMSAGGAAVWDYASISTANSNKLAAIIPFAGSMNSTQTLANRIGAANLPVWAFHNSNDGIVPVSFSRNWKNYINNYIPTPNPLVTLTEFPVVSSNAEIAHDCWTNTTVPTYKVNGINIYEWLLKYRKRTITVNQPPVAFAGDDALVFLPANLFLNGSFSSDPDGLIVSYRWRKIAGPASYNFSDSTIVNPIVQNLSAGIYSFELTVTDNQNGSSKDTILANVSTVTTNSNDRRVLIDLGPPPANRGVLTSSPSTNGYYWNNMIDARPGIRVSNAKTITNSITTIGLEVINRIDDNNGTGGIGMNSATNTGAVGIYPASATNDYAFANPLIRNGKWRVNGLEADKLYIIKFWGSKSGETINREIEIKRSDETVWKSYSAAGNTNFNNAASFTVTGKTLIDFDIRAKSSSVFGYINVIDITWSVSSTSNQPPISNAGADMTITLPLDSAALNGCTSSDPENAALKFKWRKITGPAGSVISNDTLCSTKVKNLLEGSYTLELMVTDTGGLTHKDTLALLVKTPISLAWPVLPVASCPQPYKIVILGSSTSFGTGASPLDSSWANKFRLYVQQQNAQVVVTNLSLGGFNTYSVCPTDYIPPSDRPLSDPTRNITAALALNPDAIIINLPSNDAAAGFTVLETGNNLNRIVAASDARNIPVWVTTSQPRSGLSAGQVTLLVQLKDWVNQRFGNKAIDFWTNIANIDNSVNDTYSAGDGVHLNNYGHHVVFSRVLNEKIWDTICIRRNISSNIAPVAIAGSDLVVSTTPVSLNGSLSFDPEGQALSFSWRIINNTVGSLANTSSSQPVFSATASGIYNIELTVTDNFQLNNKDTVTVFLSIPNMLPIANAGNDIILQLPTDSTRLNGSISYDIDGTIIKYKWQKIHGPAFIIGNDSIANPWIKGLINGNYLFELTVSDDSLAIDKDTVAVLVNMQPIANAGSDITITLPTNIVNVSGVASSDTDGAISIFNWRKINGPANSTIINPNSVQTNISFSIAGQYTFELVVTDNAGGVGKDTVIIIVTPDPNIAPVANAGTDKSLQLPINILFLDGRASFDANGTISAYLWTYISGPAGSQLLTPTKDTSSVSFINPGTYIFRLSVTDNGGLVSTDNVQVIVLPAPATTKAIRVNIFDGSVPYNNPQWNNWLASANLNSATFKYEDGTQSSAFVNINSYTNFRDNGINYATSSTICPPEVLRFNSTGTATRTLTLSGLNPTKQYKFEFYASRAYTTGSKSIFRTGNFADTIDADFNINDYAKFNNIIPDINGRVIFTLSFTGNYHYLAGFTIFEPFTTSSLIAYSSGLEATDNIQPVTKEAQTVNDNELSVYPNPFRDRIMVTITDHQPGAHYLSLTDVSGKILWQKNASKMNEARQELIQTAALKAGIYFLQVVTKEKRAVYKLIKK